MMLLYDKQHRRLKLGLKRKWKCGNFIAQFTKANGFFFNLFGFTCHFIGFGKMWGFCWLRYFMFSLFSFFNICVECDNDCKVNRLDVCFSWTTEASSLPIFVSFFCVVLLCHFFPVVLTWCVEIWFQCVFLSLSLIKKRTCIWAFGYNFEFRRVSPRFIQSVICCPLLASRGVAVYNWIFQFSLQLCTKRPKMKYSRRKWFEAFHLLDCRQH